MSKISPGIRNQSLGNLFNHCLETPKKMRSQNLPKKISEKEKIKRTIGEELKKISLILKKKSHGQKIESSHMIEMRKKKSSAKRGLIRRRNITQAIETKRLIISTIGTETKKIGSIIQILMLKEMVDKIHHLRTILITDHTIKTHIVKETLMIEEFLQLSTVIETMIERLMVLEVAEIESKMVSEVEEIETKMVLEELMVI